MGAGQNPIYQAEGNNVSERYLKKLCRQTFLSLWNYSSVYREVAKELCDVLIVFENHIIIFSDKNCQFPDTGNIAQDWNRWFEKAIEKSAKQLWGAERWIKEHPNRIFLDPKCTQQFPFDLPDPKTAKFHRIVVARGVSNRCERFFGGGSSGSLVIDTTLKGSDHYLHVNDAVNKNTVFDWFPRKDISETIPNSYQSKSFADAVKPRKMPFAVGNIDTTKGFVHVFDDTSLEIVLQTLDTVTDFVEYLSKKENYLLTNRLNIAGEEELLSIYLSRLNKNGEHDFPDDLKGYDSVVIGEGSWENFENSPQRKAQNLANEISYAWDSLIEAFNKHIIADTQHFSSLPSPTTSEQAIRFLAREPRTRRRFLAERLIELIEKSISIRQHSRMVLPSRYGDPYYIFLLFPYGYDIDYEEYREVRRGALLLYCQLVKIQFPMALDIVGIATESGQNPNRSEDVMYFDARQWDKEQEEKVRELQQETGFLTQITYSEETVLEYPLLKAPKHLASSKIGRNQPCPCGSGKKYKHCCIDLHRKVNSLRRNQSNK
jgi:hypothetical protein